MQQKFQNWQIKFLKTKKSLSAREFRQSCGSLIKVVTANSQIHKLIINDVFQWLVTYNHIHNILRLFNG